MAQLTRTQIAILVGLVLAICSLSVVIGFLVIDTFLLNRPSQPTATAVAGDASWAKVQKAGKIVVGTSADYPPFEYYTADFKMDGFDIALMRDLAKSMGVQVEFKDMAFDGLLSALQLGQVDAVISAVSVTSDREATNDFSTVYWMGNDGALAKADSPIVIQSVNDLANYKVGVQSGTVYQNAIQETLINTGKMPASQMFVYPLVEQGLDDLKTGKLDVMVMDLTAAQNFAAQGGLKVVGQNLNRQRYAIAFKKGANSLRDQVNQALNTAQNNGTVNLLAQQYLGVAPPPPGQPTPTPEPPPTPTPVPVVPPTVAPPPPCVDGMSYVADLTYPDYNMTAPQLIQPNTPFQKGWRIANTGTCTWTQGYVLSYAGGNTPYSAMSGQPTAIVGTVPPGKTYDIYVNLVSPPFPGVYQGFWVLKNTGGTAFGQRIWVGIQVPNTVPPTATPPAPSNIYFNAQPTSITAGQQVIFTWQVTGASAVYFYASGDVAAQRTPQAFSGSATVFPMVTTIYNLQAVMTNGQVQLRQITITVRGQPTPPPTNPPVISLFMLDPTGPIVQGQCTNVSWRVSGQVLTVEISRDGQYLYKTAPLAGTVSDCPPKAGTATYNIVATGPGGTAQQIQQLQVVANQPTQPPVPPPAVDYFNLNPTMIMMGDCTTLTWNVTGNATMIMLSRDGQPIASGLGPNGSQNDCPTYGGNILYTLSATGPGGSDSTTQSLDVAEPR
jgi:ABC-type amino acid transport substrate-binding protein